MKTKTGLVVAAVVWLVCGPAFGHEGQGHGDLIGGGALADFRVNELRIPCVEVRNLDPNVDGQFFDVILDRRGNSMNFELRFAQVEDPSLCQAIASFSRFHDEDFDSASDPTSDDFGLRNSPNLLISCERRQSRSKVSIRAKNLTSGQFLAEIQSNGHIASSPLKSTFGDEVEFKFASDPSDIAEGATAIAPDFLQGPVSAKIFNQAGETVLAADSVSCLRR